MVFEHRLTFECASDVGIQREENQDFHGEFTPDETGGGWLFVVADGMGGAAGGSTASRMAVAAVGREYASRLYDSVRDEAAIFDAIRHSIEVANSEIHNRAQIDPSLSGMGTTANVVAIHDDVIYTAHVGDSRTYRFRDGRLERLTRDHTQVQELVDQGIITPGKARNHPQGHIISRNLGGRAQVTVDIPPDGPFRIRDGDVFLVCSDGLYGLVEDEAIAEILACAPPEHATPALIELANRRGGSDNITVCVICAGTFPDSWITFEPEHLRDMLNGLQAERPTDTATFNVQYKDALEPSDFDTSRLKAITADEAKANANAPLDSRVAPTAQEMPASTATLPGEGSAGASAGAAPSPSMPDGDDGAATAPAQKSSTLVILLVVVLLVLIIAVSLAIAFIVTGKKSDSSKKGELERPRNHASQSERPTKRGSKRAKKRTRPKERASSRRRAGIEISVEQFPPCRGMPRQDPGMTVPYRVRLTGPIEEEDASLLVRYHASKPSADDASSVRCRVVEGEMVQLPKSRDALSFSVMLPEREIECRTRYEGTNPVDVHLHCTSLSENIELR